jgi:hypothetical protein
MNSGIAVRVKLFMLPHVTSPIPFSAVTPFCISR